MCTIKEQLASYSHDAWAGWMKYMFLKSTLNGDGTVTIPKDLVNRWKRQQDTFFMDLPCKETRSDFKEADKILEIIDENKET